MDLESPIQWTMNEKANKMLVYAHATQHENIGIVGYLCFNFEKYFM